MRKGFTKTNESIIPYGMKIEIDANERRSERNKEQKETYRGRGGYI